MELDYLCIDIETYNVGSKPSPYTDNILMVSYVTADTAGVIVGGDWPDWLLGMLRDDKVLKIIQNSSFEAMFILHNYGIKIRNVWDTLAVERLLVAGDNISCALVDIVRRRLGKFLDKSLRDVISTGVIDEKTKQYCLDDSLVLFPIYEQQQKEIRSRNQEYVVELECLMSVMSGEIEYHGIGFDKKLWRSYVPILEKKRRDAERKVWDFLGFSYCDNLFGESTGALSLTCGSKVLEALSKKGIKLNDYKSETLQEYFYRNPGSLKGRIVSTILDYKRWDKALGWNYPKYIEPKTGRIHSSFNSQGTATFRFSSSKPNLQQVVKPYEDINFRHLFVASPGKVFVGGDYSQIELRILADLTGEQHYIDSFTKGT
ncbi:MAG: hypothetical protein KKA68_21185, partial [Gammaproteobacteria bacterium]|nr:hypothetical protein [Gammaproteobacteria bacterium]